MDQRVGAGQIGPLGPLDGGVGGVHCGGTKGFILGEGVTVADGLVGQTVGAGGIYIFIGNNHVISGFMTMGNNNNAIIAMATSFTV